MLKLLMVDLIGQHQKIQKEVDKAITDVFSESIFINGSQVQRFESDLSLYLHSPFCISCANGTDALQIAMMALDLQPADEVIIPAFTYIATVEAAALLKLKPVFADIDPSTFSLDPQSLMKTVSPKTRAIIPVHLYGQCAPMSEILEIAEKGGIAIIEDTAQAIGSKYIFPSGETRFAGTIGTIGITSFFPSKNLGCYGDGGALFTQSEELAKKIRMIANHGQERKYYHDMIGVNSRLDTLQAAILSVKLKYLDQYTQARQKAAAWYDQAFTGNSWFDIPDRNPHSTHVFHQYTIKVKSGKRDALKSFLESKGIPSMIYYPLPVHLQKAYAYLGYKKGDFPVAERLCEEALSLPMHTELTEKQLEYICHTVLSFFKK